MLIKNQKKFFWAVFLMTAFLLGSCGQKGPLVLPNKPDTDKSQTESTATQPVKPPSDTAQPQGVLE